MFTLLFFHELTQTVFLVPSKWIREYDYFLQAEEKQVKRPFGIVKSDTR